MSCLIEKNKKKNAIEYKIYSLNMCIFVCGKLVTGDIAIIFNRDYKNNNKIERSKSRDNVKKFNHRNKQDCRCPFGKFIFDLRFNVYGLWDGLLNN